MPSTIERIRARLPQFYSDNVVKMLSAFVDEIDSMNNNAARIGSMNNIDTTYGDDLYARWGSLFMIPRQNSESDESYKARLKLMVTSLTGGTADSIKYSIAVGMGINNDPVAMNRIGVYDGWEYTGDVDSSLKLPGNVICIIDLENHTYTGEMETIVRNAVNNVKAAGVSAYVTFYNYRVEYYIMLDDLIYMTLNNIEYDKIGGIE